MGPKITSTDREQLFQKLDELQKDDVLILSGSVPSDISEKIYGDILYRLRDKGVLSVVDASRELLMNALTFHPFLIKPNNHEIEEIFHVTLESENDIIDYAGKLQDLGARNVLVSLAKDGSLLLDKNGNIHRMGICEGIFPY